MPPRRAGGQPLSFHLSPAGARWHSELLLLDTQGSAAGLNSAGEDQHRLPRHLWKYPGEAGHLRRSRLPQQLQLGLRLIEPVRYAHFAVHRRGGVQMFLGLHPLTGALAEVSEPEMAVGDKGPKPKLACYRERLPVVHLRGSGIRRIGERDDVTEQSKCACLIAAIALFMRDRYRLLRASARILDSADRQVGIAEPDQVHRPMPDGGDSHRLLR